LIVNDTKADITIECWDAGANEDEIIGSNTIKVA
jgi:hypothetical protein